MKTVPNAAIVSMLGLKPQQIFPPRPLRSIGTTWCVCGMALAVTTTCGSGRLSNGQKNPGSPCALRIGGDGIRNKISEGPVIGTSACCNMVEPFQTGVPVYASLLRITDCQYFELCEGELGERVTQQACRLDIEGLSSKVRNGRRAWRAQAAKEAWWTPSRTVRLIPGLSRGSLE